MEQGAIFKSNRSQVGRRADVDASAIDVSCKLTTPEGQVGKGKSSVPLPVLVRPAGIEPATPAFGGPYSIH